MPSTNNTPTAHAAQFAIMAIAVFMASATPYAQSKHSALSDAYAFGAYASYNICDGYIKFDGVDGYLHEESTNPFIFGVSIGRRVSIDNPRLRLQGALEFGRGSVKDGEYYEERLNIPQMVSQYSVYWTGGILADAHWLFPTDYRTYFVSAGIGAHLTYFNTELKTVAGGENVAGGSSDMRGALSPSINIGCGTEYKLDGRGAVCISYNMRYWQSASYREAGMFLLGVNYTEFFFSHAVQLQYLLPRRSNK